MKRTLTSLLMSATIGLDSRRDNNRCVRVLARPRVGPEVAAGVIGGAVTAGAIIASRPPGYVVYPGYAQPVYGPGCYWASRAVYDPYGRVAGYSGQPVQVCPNYAPPAANAAPPPPVAYPAK